MLCNSLCCRVALGTRGTVCCRHWPTPRSKYINFIIEQGCTCRTRKTLYQATGEKIIIIMRFFVFQSFLFLIQSADQPHQLADILVQYRPMLSDVFWCTGQVQICIGKNYVQDSKLPKIHSALLSLRTRACIRLLMEAQPHLFTLLTII